MRRGFNPDDKPTSLDFEQQICAAWAYFVQGVDQSTIAALYGVNQGRIAEACKAIRDALEPAKEQK